MLGAFANAYLGVFRYAWKFLHDLSLSSIVTFVMRLFAVKPVAYIRSLGRWQVVGFRLGAMIEKIESV